MASLKGINTMFVDPFKALDILDLIGKAMEEKDEEILDVNRQQMSKGIKSDGSSMGRYKNFKYKNRFQPVDLLYTGSFQAKMTLATKKKSAEVFSQDEKNGILEKRYGKNIFGILDAYKPTVEQIIFDPLGKLIRNQLFK